MKLHAIPCRELESDEDSEMDLSKRSTVTRIGSYNCPVGGGFGGNIRSPQMFWQHWRNVHLKHALVYPRGVASRVERGERTSTAT